MNLGTQSNNKKNKPFKIADNLVINITKTKLKTYSRIKIRKANHISHIDLSNPD